MDGDNAFLSILGDLGDNIKIFVIFVLCAFFSCWTSGYSGAGVLEDGLDICLIIALFLTAVELFSVTIDSIVRRGFVDIIINAVCLIASIFLSQLIIEKWNLPTEDWLLMVWILIIFNVSMIIPSAIKPFFDDESELSFGDNLLLFFENARLIAIFVITFFGLHNIGIGVKLDTWCVMIAGIVVGIDVILCIWDFIIGDKKGWDIVTLVLNIILFFILFVATKSHEATLEVPLSTAFLYGLVWYVGADLLLAILGNTISGIADAVNG